MARRPDTSPQTLEILHAFLGSGWRYGYDLSRETGIASGTLYPILIRLSGRGLLEARWDELPNGRRRRSYRLTGEGVAYADARLAERRSSTSTAVAAKA